MSWKMKQFIVRIAYWLLYTAEQKRMIDAIVTTVRNDPRISLYEGTKFGREARRDEASYRACTSVHGLGHAEINMAIEMAHFISKAEPITRRHPQRIEGLPQREA